MTFWSDFWPNLAATTAGIIIGVPFALWLNRKAVQQSQAAERLAEREKVADALQAIEIAISDNRPRLQRINRVLGAGNSLFDPGLDTSAWEALHGGLTSALGDPRLRQRMAYHFVRLAGLSKLMDTLVRYATEPNTAAVIAARQPLAAGIKEAATELDQEAEHLIKDLNATRSKLLNA